jgi:ABC-type branched-subunit amino acid transport system substrate-binding protein
MPKNRFIRFAAFLPAVALAAAMVPAAAGAEDGVTPTQVTLGGTHPYSGPASAYGIIGKGILAYFAYVNDHGGVNGRKIVYEDKDDGYNPAQTVPLVKGMVEQDHVFALFNTLGTACNLSIRQYLNDNKVPQLWVSTGATTWGTDAAKYPWTIGFNADYQAEAIVFAKSIIAHNPNAKIAILYQNDDFGQDYLTGLTKGLGSHANQIVKQASYEVTDPDVRSQMATLQGSGADTLVIAATPKFAIGAMAARGLLNWTPTTYLTDVSAATTMMQAAAKSGGAPAVDGIISAAYTIDPTNPSLANTPGMKLYRDVLAKEGAGLDANNGFLLYGMAAAYTMVNTLQKAGKDLTRAKLMDAAIHMNENNPFLWPGVSLTTSPGDRFPIREEQLIKYTSTGFQPFGPIIDARK